ncbi:hypothetical protein PG997_002249 [Apiospora hydei]|uniref:Uncharacterized protein n=1 Tax=Apiospora hydei TaxID=1337664 RepID=A0ABR1X8X2_9PEZI
METNVSSPFRFQPLPPEIRTSILEFALRQNEFIRVFDPYCISNPIRSGILNQNISLSKSDTSAWNDLAARGLYQPDDDDDTWGEDDKLYEDLKRVALFQVSKQVYLEAFPVFMRCNTFLVLGPRAGVEWMTLFMWDPVPAFTTGKVICWVEPSQQGDPKRIWLRFVQMLHKHTPKCVNYAFNLVPDGQEDFAWDWHEYWAKRTYNLPTAQGPKQLKFPEWLALHFEEVKMGVYRTLGDVKE